jgi:hypothetical protein
MSVHFLVITLIAGAALPLSADLVNVPDEPQEQTLAIVLNPEQEFSAISLREMQNELGYIMGPLGLHLKWRRHGSLQPAEGYNHIIAVRFRGRCESSEPWNWEPVTGPLASTETVDGRLIPYSDVDCEQVRNLIYHVLTGESFLRRASLLGRALGRVLAHEVYHILAGTSEHGRDGINKVRLTPSDLVEGVLRFEPAEIARIRENLAPRSPIVPGGTGAPAAEPAGQEQR